MNSTKTQNAPTSRIIISCYMLVYFVLVGNFNWLTENELFDVIEWIFLGFVLIVFIQDLLQNSFRLKYWFLFLFATCFIKSDYLPSFELGNVAEKMFPMLFFGLVIFVFVGSLIYQTMGGKVRSLEAIKEDNKAISHSNDILNWGSTLGSALIGLLLFNFINLNSEAGMFGMEGYRDMLFFCSLIIVGILFLINQNALQYVFPFVIFSIVFGTPLWSRYAGLEPTWLFDFVAFHLSLLAMFYVDWSDKLSPRRFFDYEKRMRREARQV